MKTDLDTTKYRVGHETLSLKQWIDRVISKGYTVYTEEAHGKFTYGYLHNPSKGDSYCFRRNIERDYIKTRINPKDESAKSVLSADMQNRELIVNLNDEEIERFAIQEINEDGFKWFETQGYSLNAKSGLIYSGFIIHDWQDQDYSVGIGQGYISFSYPG